MDIAALAEKAQEAFWEVVAKETEGAITGGDFPPDATFAFDQACEAAVQAWISFNKD